MVKYNHVKLVLLILFVILQTAGLFAQVTIGSSIPPNPGTLLDLKEFVPDSRGGVNSRKGIVLPRVSLSNKDDLTDILDSTDLTTNLEHVGLLVYNVNKCFYKGKGLYVWSGQAWSSVFDAVDLRALSLPNSYVVSQMSRTLSIPVAKAITAWEYYSSPAGGNLLSGIKTIEDLSVLISAENGDIIDGPPQVTRQDRDGSIIVKLKGNVGSATISLKVGGIVCWSWYLEVTS